LERGEAVTETLLFLRVGRGGRAHPLDEPLVQAGVATRRGNANGRRGDVRVEPRATVQVGIYASTSLREDFGVARDTAKHADGRGALLAIFRGVRRPRVPSQRFENGGEKPSYEALEGGAVLVVDRVGEEPADGAGDGVEHRAILLASQRLEEPEKLAQGRLAGAGEGPLVVDQHQPLPRVELANRAGEQLERPVVHGVAIE